MTNLDKFLLQLPDFEAKLRLARRTNNERQLKQAKTKLFPVLDEIFTAYKTADAPDRVDIHIAFDSRPELLTAFADYLTSVLDRAEAAGQKHKQAEMKKLLETAVIADSVLEARLVNDRYLGVQTRLKNRAKAENFNTETYAKFVRVTPKDYLQRALTFERIGNRPNAGKALGRALDLSPNLKSNEKVQKLAADITDQRPTSAMQTLGDVMHRKAFVDQFNDVPLPANAHKIANAKSLSWFKRHGIHEGDLIVGGITLAIFTYLFYVALNAILKEAGVPMLPPTQRFGQGMMLGLILMFSIWYIFSGAEAVWKRKYESRVNFMQLLVGALGGAAGGLAYAAVASEDDEVSVADMKGGAAVIVGIGSIIGGALMLAMVGVEYNTVPLDLRTREILLFYLLGFFMFLPTFMSSWIIQIYEDMSLSG